ncbi:TatD family hydrolase [Shewanella sp. YIC-542]|uniref:TatD family hydrolase n=1 Tax=Shewanella mytili TaxID=3377111 RepID=UPI00398E4918
MLTDSHAHLDFPEFDSDRAMLVQQMQQVGVRDVLLPGVAPEYWPRQITLAGSYRWRYALGIHPWYCPDNIPEAIARLAQQVATAKHDPLWVGIGECGLDKPIAQLPDGHARKVSWQRQIALLTPQLALAQGMQRPLILHAVRCHEPMQQLLGQHPGCYGVIHGFSGSYEVAINYWRMGFRLGIGGLLLNSRAKKLRHAVMQLPAEALLVETDAPAMAPAERANTRNTPLLLPEVVAEMARLRNQGNVQLSEQLQHNFHQLFEP